jgi:hypothetical protein
MISKMQIHSSAMQMLELPKINNGDIWIMLYKKKPELNYPTSKSVHAKEL